MNLTAKQSAVLEELRKIGRENFFRYRDSTPYLFERHRENAARGDASCTYGIGGLTWGVGGRIGMSASQVLAIFKALERKGLVLRETRNPTYQRPLYWWPVGLAKELHDEITNSGDEVCDG